jgi:hypothetical protein
MTSTGKLEAVAESFDCAALDWVAACAHDRSTQRRRLNLN